VDVYVDKSFGEGYNVLRTNRPTCRCYARGTRLEEKLEGTLKRFTMKGELSSPNE
jgi:hypothetical protein